MDQPTSRQGRLVTPSGAVELVDQAAAAVLVNSSHGTQHCMHDDREFSRDGDSGALEADLLAKLHSPVAQITIGVAAGQDDDSRLVQE